MTPGQAAGQPATVVLAPAESGLTVAGAVTTAASGTPVSVALDRARGETVVRATGSIPVGPDVIRYVAVDRPAVYTTRMLASALARRGITLRDGLVTVRELAVPPSQDATETVRYVTSRPRCARWPSR